MVIPCTSIIICLRWFLNDPGRNIFFHTLIVLHRFCLHSMSNHGSFTHTLETFVSVQSDQCSTSLIRMHNRQVCSLLHQWTLLQQYYRDGWRQIHSSLGIYQNLDYKCVCMCVFQATRNRWQMATIAIFLQKYRNRYDSSTGSFEEKKIQTTAMPGSSCSSHYVGIYIGILELVIMISKKIQSI